MNTKQLRGSLCLLLAALVWGCAFVAQRVGMDYVGPFTFHALRSLLAGLVLLPVVALIERKKGAPPEGEKRARRRDTIRGGVLCGAALCAASLMQQCGIQYTTAAKAGFITTLYVLIVPVFALFLGRKTSPRLWLCAAVALVGLYLLSISGGFALSKGDALVLGCSFLFAVQILLVDHYVQRVNAARLCCAQFLLSGAISLILMFVFEKPSLAAIAPALPTIAYAGILSGGLGYTLQIVGQRDTDPTLASMLMSFEAVFAALAGLVFLGQGMRAREVVGCCLMFFSVVSAQLPEGWFKRKKAAPEPTGR